MEDIVYVIYFDSKIFIEHGRKCAYLKGDYAKSVVTSESRRVAHDMFDKARTGQCWYEIGERNKQKWINKAKERFKIREFIERSEE